jgi:hypothetical protein
MLTYVPLHVEKSNSFIQPLFEIKIRFIYSSPARLPYVEGLPMLISRESKQPIHTNPN